jgi:hypothetical protein
MNQPSPTRIAAQQARARHRNHTHNMFGPALTECVDLRHRVAQSYAAMIMDAEPDTKIDTVQLGQDMWLCQATIFDQTRVVAVEVAGADRPFVVTATWLDEHGCACSYRAEADVTPAKES